MKISDIRRGDKVVLDLMSGLVPAEVLEILPADGYHRAGPEVRVRITATRGAWKKGMIDVVSPTSVLLPEHLRPRKYGTRIIETARRPIVVRRSRPRSRSFVVESNGELVGANMHFDEALDKAKSEHQRLGLPMPWYKQIEVPKDLRARAFFYEGPGLADRMRGRGYRI